MVKNRVLSFLLLGCTMSLIVTNSLGADEFPLITAEALKARMDAGETLFLLNPLSEIPYNEGHIPGSSHVPLHTIPTTDTLPENKDTLIITYCLGPK